MAANDGLITMLAGAADGWSRKDAALAVATPLVSAADREQARRDYTEAKQAWLDAWIAGDPASDELWDRARALWRQFEALGGDVTGGPA